MNFFSVLDESDNEEERKVVPAKKGTTAPAPAAKKDAAPAPKKDAAPAKKDAPKTGKAVEEKPKSKGKQVLLQLHALSYLQLNNILQR